MKAITALNVDHQKKFFHELHELIGKYTKGAAHKHALLCLVDENGDLVYLADGIKVDESHDLAKTGAAQFVAAQKASSGDAATALAPTSGAMMMTAAGCKVCVWYTTPTGALGHKCISW